MKNTNFSNPPYAAALLDNPKSAWLWLIIRLYVSYIWLEAALQKVTSPLWVGDKAGVALSGFMKAALAKTAGPHPDVQSWYALFLQNVVLPHAAFWSHLISWGELAVGIALFIGLSTGIAAFFGLFMNFNFLMAGAVSVNPILFVLSIGIMLAWKVSGYYGLDRVALPAIGTPWQPGKLFARV